MQDDGRAMGAVNVQDFLNQNRLTPFQWMIFALCFLIVLLDGFDTAAIGFIAPSLIGEWGVSRQALAPVLSAALFGLATGAVLAGPLSDRVGRKLVLSVSVLLFGAACAWSAFAGNLTELATLRFVTGIGLGAAMPNAVTLMSEYCPDRRRAMLTNAMFCGFPLGAALGGFLAAWMIPHWGWRSVLLLGGVAPVLLAIVIALMLPESVRFLLARGGRQEQVRAALRRISASADQAVAFVTTETTAAGSGIGVIMSRPYRLGTMMLWLAYFMGLVIFYALINWMPLLLKDAGLSTHHATLVAALFPLGGVGAVLSGWLMDRYNANLVVATGFALTAASIFAIGQSAGNLGLLTTVVFVAGVVMNTAQSSLPALAASFYPTRGRATGVSWMMGFGRLGGIAGSFLVAELARLQFGIGAIFGVVALAGAAAAVALLVKMASGPDNG
ncbi:MFS transporter [Massilia sp. HP4]|uniref:MFS transporter n=1 Tax=Massilia sp. HP4 TaxID=2562316 RepID=UPI0010C072E0|nr:MFS transporter [Massilia sp. HP4]